MAHSIRAARLAKRRARKPGDFDQLLLVLWGAIREAEDILYAAAEADTETRLRAIHALSQSASVYARILADEDTERRLQAVEAALQGQAA